MTATGTRERKRERKAAPSPFSKGVPFGCVVSFWLYLVASLAMLAAARHGFFLAISAPGLIIGAVAVVRLVRRYRLLAAVRSEWATKGIRCLVVYSNSPTWEARIHSEWLPRLSPVAVTLDWGERQSWGNSLAVRVFRFFCGADVNFNPAVVVFRGLRPPLVFRFYYAFKEAKGGRGQYLAAYERRMFAAVLGGAA